MMRRFFGRTTLLCFSPPVMVATMLVEIGLAIWVATRFTFSTTRRLIVLIMICLAGFQLSEYQVCSQSATSEVWARAGYILITLLPALGYDVVLRLWNYKTPWRWAGYALAAGFMGMLAFSPQAISGGICTGNYVIFSVAEPLNGFWTFYYLSMVLGGLALAAAGAWTGPTRSRAALRWMAVGYLAFTVPSYTIYWIAPQTGVGLPSIMCGFAVILALILALRVAPSQAANR